MNCPRCHASALDERERDGVVVDVCRTCRGVWLDRGELEKLIARSMRELDDLAPRSDDAPPRGDRHRYDDDNRHHPAPRKKRHWLESLGDVFD